MARAVIGVIGNRHVINDSYIVSGGADMISEAIRQASDCLPLIIPANPDFVDLADVMAACDGFLFTGGRPNVHASFYGETHTEAYGDHDLARDNLALPLIRALTETGQPYLAVCRGFQEMNVAFGGSLYPEIRDLPGRDNHRMPPDGTLEEKFALRHDVTLTPGGPGAQLFGADVVRTNSLHGQGIKEPGKGIIIDGIAPDGTPEVIYAEGAPGLAFGVQWHPEYRAAEDPVSRPLFAALGDAARAWAAGR